MSLKDAEQEALELLYKNYIEQPGSISGIGEVAKKYDMDAHELGKHLVEHGYVRNQQYRPLTFFGEITLSGIDRVDPNYIGSMTDKIVKGLGAVGGKGDAFKILDLEPKDDIRIRDIVKYLEQRGILKDTMYHVQQIIIQLSLKGKEMYESN